MKYDTAAPFDAGALRQAVERTFEERHTHPMPPALPFPPLDWETPFRRIASELALELDLAAGHALVARFLDPVLGGAAPAGSRWAPAEAEWRHRH